MTYNKALFEAAHERFSRAPLALTDEDIDQLATVDPSLEIKAYEARRQAQLAIVQQHTPIQTKTATTPTRAMNAKTWARYAEGFMEHVLAPIFRSHKEKVAALEERIKALEARPVQKWAGVHIKGMQYSEATLVTHGGSVWAAETTTTTSPGESGSDWRLILKRGAHS